MRQILLATAAILCYCTTLAWGANAKSEPVVEPAPDQRVICKRIKVTGTHFRQRVCRTQTEIDEAQKDAKRFTDDAVRYEQARSNYESQSR